MKWFIGSFHLFNLPLSVAFTKIKFDQEHFTD